METKKIQITVRNCANGFMIYSNEQGKDDYIANNIQELCGKLSEIFSQKNDTTTVSREDK